VPWERSPTWCEQAPDTPLATFAELMADEVKARAAELKAATVGELEPDAVAQRAGKPWVVPPGGSLL
jgi:hypothetical protein